MNEVLKKYLTSLNAHSVEKQSIEEYKDEMVNKVIPEIAEAVKERQRLAAESRLWPVTRPRTSAED